MAHSTKTMAGLYAITDRTLCQALGVETAVAEALRGGAAIVQYRDKTSDHARREREASALVQLCREFGALCIINDDVELAEASAADGVHIGRDDVSLADARRRLGQHRVIGVSCYHHMDLARAAERAGADYVAFGRFHPSKTKPGQPLADVALLAQAGRELRVPIAAIGGITAGNAGPLVGAGASMLACIHSVFGQPDVRGAAAALASLFR